MSEEMNDNFEGEAIKPTGNQSAPTEWGSDGLDDSNGKAINVTPFKEPTTPQKQEVRQEIKEDIKSGKSKRDPNNPDDGWANEFTEKSDTVKDIYQDIREDYTQEEIDLINAGATLPEIEALRKHLDKQNNIEEEKEEKKLIDDKFEDFDNVDKSTYALREKMGIDDGVDYEGLSKENKLKYYKNLESQFSRENNEKKEEVVEEPSFKFDTNEITIDKINDFIKNDNLSEGETELFEKYSQIVLDNNGVLPESILKEIAEKDGSSIGMMKHYIESKVKEITSIEENKQKEAYDKIESEKQELIKIQTEKNDNAITRINNEIASTEEINKAIQWGSENLSEYQQNVFNRDLQNVDTLFDASKEIFNLYKNSQIQNQDPIYGKSQSNKKQKDDNVFNSYEEYDKMTDNPLYSSDMNFKQQVINKLNKSDWRSWSQFQ